jgi:hypothetical protein
MHLVAKRHCPEKWKALLGSSGPHLGCNLIGFFPNLLSGTLSRQSLLHSALLARLQVEGVTLHFSDAS